MVKHKKADKPIIMAIGQTTIQIFSDHMVFEHYIKDIDKTAQVKVSIKQVKSKNFRDLIVMGLLHLEKTMEKIIEDNSVEEKTDG